MKVVFIINLIFAIPGILSAMQEPLLVHEEMIIDVPLPTTSFTHLPQELKIKILEQVIIDKITSVTNSTEWDVLSPAHDLIHKLGTVHKAFRGILNDQLATAKIIDALDKKVHSGAISSFLGTKVSPQWRLFSLAERLGTRGSLQWIMQQEKFENFFAQLKNHAMTTKNSKDKEGINKFVVKIAQGYSVADYLACDALKVEQEYINEIRKYFKQDGIATLNLSNAALKTLDGLDKVPFFEIQQIKINNNLFVALLPDFNQFVNLNRIEITGNRYLKSVDFGIFALLKKLRRLDFCRNAIVQIECSQKLESEHIYDLNLSKNAIELIDVQAIANINADYIDLSFNPLRAMTNENSCKPAKRIELLFLDPVKVEQFKHHAVQELLVICR